MLQNPVLLNVKQILTVHIHVRETSTFQFKTRKNAQLKFTYRLFTECINLCDVSENLSNKKEPNIILLPEHQYQSNSKLRLRENLWKFWKKKHVNKMHKEVIIQVGKHFNSYRRGSNRTV
jgi:hypothetical protein